MSVNPQDMSRFRSISRLHDALTSYVRPKNSVPGSNEYDLAGPFSTMIGLASIFIPFFVIEFLASGYHSAAAAITVAGSIMLLSVPVFRVSGSITLARELFLFALFGFLVWEAFYFDSIYSPGSTWFAVLPVIGILLGSVVSAIIWLLAGILVLSITYYLTVDTALAALGRPEFSVLFLASVAAMIIAIFLFVWMVDSARHVAIKRLANANDANRALAEHDDLTGLLNRRAFHLRLESLLAEGRNVYVLFSDLDGFKDINDTYGHEAGDIVLKRTAALLKHLCISENVVLARLGGDEFAFVISDAHAETADVDFADTALRIFEAPMEVAGRQISIGMSFGSARPQGNAGASELMRRADLAMYEAKKQGGKRYCCFEPAMDAKRSLHTRLAAELARDISSGRLKVYYQPIVNSASRQMTGVEALARWTSETGKSIPPDVFIPIAEETGLINSLGLYVLERACRDASAWPGLKLSVNLSPIQFRSVSLVEDILCVLRRTTFPAERLELEVTEGYLIEHRERAQPIIAALHSSGITIALDDFGSGYSSIGYLRQYAFDRLKLDKSITQGMNDAAERGVVQATTLLAKSLSLRVTAEGVETSEQAQILHLAGCDDLQGFLFGRPVSAEEIDRAVSDHSAATLKHG